MLSLGTALILLRRNTSWWQPALFLYFVVMEGLQFLQYQVVNQCDHPLNQGLTLLAWAHISFQPLIFNGYLFAMDARMGPKRPHMSVIQRFVLQLCGVAAAIALVKGFVLPLGLVDPASLPPALPHCVEGVEHMCGRATCAFQGAHHIAWRLPLLGAGYYMPNVFLHFFLSFTPIMLVGTGLVRAFVVLAVAAGPVAVDWFWTGGDTLSHLHEMPSVWCLMSVAYCWTALLFEFVVGPLVAGQQPGSKGGSRRKAGGKQL
eukprot:CAMPEP_0202857738 /NCGR_PEP_ID=MMETSP1391-20130828/561_1 /ASSEMBLY_ACC=CAM_ASM_000867 /TAXON_ID=1034604 /ORGANISM="Chlamydomonas leiostraca, Strain SAG 11-49" /LENGTH=259 /DNA_ID=CAMNT_0049536579 /DNA_START=244 /DNA_END=1023 /DNA_ORIENTATION=+